MSRIAKRVIRGLASSALLLICGTAFAQGQVQQTPEFVPNRVIVKFKADPAEGGAAAVAGAEAGLRRGPSGETTAAFRNRLRTTLRVRTARRITLTNAEVWDLQGQRVEDVVAQWKNDPRIAYIEPDYILRASLTPNDPSFASLYGMTKIQATQAWNLTTGSAAVVVGVIDSGVDYTHPDLAANIWTNPGEAGPFAADGIDNDNNGYVDDVHGYDFANNDGDPMDDNQHGTHVAGTIAAVGNNGVGVVGANWTARIMALKFLRADGFGFTSNAVRAIQYATRMGARLTNNSWGGSGSSQALVDAINEAAAANSLFVAAAGNENLNIDTYPSSAIPASLGLDNIISVAATDPNDARATFSNYGATNVDLGAPGVGILSTVPGGQYAALSGTSMASPHVAGVAALIYARHPSFHWEDVKAIILESVDLVPSMTGITVTGGRLNAYRALQRSDTWTALAAPMAVVTPPFFAVALDPDATTTRTLTVSNPVGSRRLRWTLSESCSWLAANQTSGNLVGGAQAQVQLTVDTFAMSAGFYPCSITLSSNDPVNPTRSVAFNLSVNLLPPPVPSVSPNSFTFDLETGQVFEASLSIGNAAAAGARNVHWSATVVGADAAWLTLASASGVVASAGSQAVPVTASASGRAAGTYTATIRVTTLEGATFDVPASLTVRTAIVGGRQLYLFRYNEQEVQRTNLDGTSGATIFAGPGHPVTGDVDEIHRKVYWIDFFDSIRRSDLDGLNVETVVPTGDQLTSLAVDGVNGHLYWMDSRQVTHIYRSNLDGTNPQVLLQTASTYPTEGLRLDVAGGKIYYNVVTPLDDVSPGVWRANLDGSNPEHVIVGNVLESGFDLDLVNRRIYFAGFERVGNDFVTFVRRADLDGTHVETLYNVEVLGLRLDVAGGDIHWVNRDSGYVQRARMDGSGVTTLSLTARGLALDLSVTTTTTVTCAPGPFAYTGAALTPCTAAVTGDGGLNASLPVTYANNVNAGTATASASYPGDLHYSPSSDSETFTIDKAASTVVVVCPAQVPFTGSAQAPCTATVTGAGGLNQVLTVSYANDVGPGVATASASYAGDANHHPGSGSTTFVIGRAPSTVTVTCLPPTVTYTGAALTPCTAAVTSQGLNQSLAVTYANNVNAGTATASASYAGDALHEPATGSTTFTIAKAPSAVTLTCPASAVYTTLPVRPCTATVTGAGGLNQALTVTYLNNTAIGTATATASYAGGPNHTANSATKTFVIRRWFF